MILVGDGPIYEQIKDEHEDYVYPVGLQNNVISWYLAADICMLQLSAFQPVTSQ